MLKILKKVSYKRYLESLAIVVLDIGFFTKTNANRVPAFALIVGFILVALSVYLLIYLVLSFMKLYGLPIKRKRRLTLYLTGVSSFLIALGSVGELNGKDIVVILPLAVIAYIYINYAKSNEKKIS